MFPLCAACFAPESLASLFLVALFLSFSVLTNPAQACLLPRIWRRDSVWDFRSFPEIRSFGGPPVPFFFRSASCASWREIPSALRPQPAGFFCAARRQPPLARRNSAFFEEEHEKRAPIRTCPHNPSDEAVYSRLARTRPACRAPPNLSSHFIAFEVDAYDLRQAFFSQPTFVAPVVFISFTRVPVLPTPPVISR